MPVLPLRRAFVVALALLLAVAVSAGSAGLAGAEGNGDPMIIAPDGSDPLYAGFSGPFVVDFRFAPAGTYAYGVSLLPPGGGSAQPVGTAREYISDGLGQVPLRTPALGAGAYRFEISDGAGHEASLLFTVRGPQPRCSVILPRAVRVNAPEEVIVGRLGADCDRARVTYASWDVRHVSQGYVNLMIFNRTTRDTWKFTAGEPLGAHYSVPVQTEAPGDDVILQNVRLTRIRLASRQTVTASRDGRVVTLSGSLVRYTPSAFGFRGWRSRTVTISYRTCGTCLWQRLGARTTDAMGSYSLKVRTSAFRRYRVTVPGTAGVWAPAPAYVRR